jgi:hypothetical protein
LFGLRLFLCSCANVRLVDLSLVHGRFVELSLVDIV